MATTAQAGDTTEQPIKQLNEASDLIHWPDGFSPKQTDAFTFCNRLAPVGFCVSPIPRAMLSTCPLIGGAPLIGITIAESPTLTKFSFVSSRYASTRKESLSTIAKTGLPTSA